MRRALRFASLLLPSLMLSACGGPDASYRYKLTVTVDTPDGAKIGSNVVQIDYYNVSFPMSGESHHVYGQALYLDTGAKPLVVLLSRAKFSGGNHWMEDDPVAVVARLCLGKEDGVSSFIESAKQFGSCQGVYPLEFDDMPDMVTFDDPKDPNTGRPVNPRNPAEALGPGVSLRSVTIQITNESITKEVDEQLPWVRNWGGRIALNNSERLHDFVDQSHFIEDGKP